ncbi:MAG: hypothetical protein AAGG81_06265, partial [Chlamydiota bacterium]
MTVGTPSTVGKPSTVGNPSNETRNEETQATETLKSTKQGKGFFGKLKNIAVGGKRSSRTSPPKDRTPSSEGRGSPPDEDYLNKYEIDFERKSQDSIGSTSSPETSPASSPESRVFKKVFDDLSDDNTPLQNIPSNSSRRLEEGGAGSSIENLSSYLLKCIQNTEEFFQNEALENKTKLDDFLQKFPKIDLHMHMDGSIQSRELLNFAAKEKLLCHLGDDLILFGKTKDELESEVKKRNHPNNTYSSERVITAEELRNNNKLRDKFEETVRMRGAVGNSKSGHHRHFFQAFETLESIAKHMPLKKKIELLLLNTEEHIRYMEPSIWFEKEEVPESFKEKFKEFLTEQGNLKGLTVDAAKGLIDREDLK